MIFMVEYEYVDERTFRVNGVLCDMNDAVILLNMKEETIEQLREQLE